MDGLSQDPTTGTETGEITLFHDQTSNIYDYYWDISVQQETTGATPNVDLLDDANNDGSVNCSDQPYVNVDPGNVILVSDPSQDPTGNADAAHLRK